MMTVEVRTCFAGSLLISSAALPLSMGTLKIYVADICRINPKNIVKLNVKIKIVFLLLFI